jgi:UDP-glucose 4-epimerase
LGKKLKKRDLKPIERNTPRAKKARRFGWVTKLPIVKQWFRKKQNPRGFDVEAAQIMPVNLEVGEYVSEAVPLKLMDYFIDKAGTIVLMSCPCRNTNDCQNHSIELGCVWMGKGAANLNLTRLPGRVTDGKIATKEEAKAHARAALKDGLIPALGKLRGDAKVYRVLDYEDEFMNFCFCCNCCCVTASMKYINSDYKNYIKPMEGVTITTDPDKCTGCGECFKVCIYDGLKMVKGKAVHTKNCLVCGHCEMICPNKAISINFAENKNIDDVMDNIIQRYEKIVDISG